MNDDQQIKVVRDSLRKFNRRAGVLKSNPYGIGLSLSQSSALIDIHRFERIKASDLVPLLHLEKSSVSRLILGLQERGLVRISDDPSDGRSKVLSLSKSGEKAVEVINDVSNLSIKEVFKQMDSKTKLEIVSAFKKLAEVVI